MEHDQGMCDECWVVPAVVIIESSIFGDRKYCWWCRTEYFSGKRYEIINSEELYQQLRTD